MKMILAVICTYIYCCSSAFAFQLPGEKSADYLAVQARNKQLSTYLIKGDISSLTNLYVSDCNYLPEFGPTMNNRMQVGEFYRNWLKNSRVTVYDKSIYEVETIANYLLETGVFLIKYKIGTDAEREYHAKYMVIWKKAQSGQISILAEAFGADHKIEPADVPYPAADVTANQPKEQFMVGPALKSALQEYDKRVALAVVAGDGKSRAEGFTNDGIYMPHFDSMQIGMKAIKPYMLKTYFPHTISYVKDSFREVFDTGKFVLLTGHFHVILNNPQKSGFDGNMLNLMIRGSDGKLLMYRQLAHN